MPYGHTLIAKYGMATNRHRHDYGTTMEQLAEIAVSHRYNAGFNPDAYYRDPITDRRRAVGRDDRRPVHQAAVLHPLGRRLRDRAGRRGPGRRLPHRAGVGARHRARPPRTRPCRSGTDFNTGPASVSGPRAFAAAGVTPADIDLCCIYDAFTFMVLETLEDLGFCAKGEGGPFVSDGKLRLGGALPTNPDGGGLSACHPGMRGLVPAGRGHPPAPRRVRRHRHRPSARWPTPSWPACPAPAAGSAPTAP